MERDRGDQLLAKSGGNTVETAISALVEGVALTRNGETTLVSLDGQEVPLAKGVQDTQATSVARQEVEGYICRRRQ